MSKFSLIARLQHWMDSVPGQTFMNYAYSWGAAVVILGTLFKLTHIPGANAMLFIGMGTEVFVFFIAGFDRPFDAKKDTELADDFIDLEELESLKEAANKAASTEGPSVIIGGAPVQGSVVTAGEGVLPVGSTISEGSTSGGTVVIGGGGGGISDAAAANLAAAAQAAAAAGSVSGGFPVSGSPAGSVAGGFPASGSSAGSVAGGFPASEGAPTGAGLSAADAANLAVAAQAAAGAQAALAAAGGPEGLLASAQAANAPEVEDAVEAYVDQLQQLTEVLGRVREQASRMTTDSEEMVNLNRTLTGINTIYEMQLKSVSQQVGTIDHINEQTRRMAQQIEELNGVYARMIEALTVNMPKTPQA